ncbi:MAG: hypothetical protein MK165_15665 [Pirellulaceae bacterium]|nr:hypothetical protein [Pirellulaceae bacterium]
MKNIATLSLIAATSILTGCMTSPGDRHIVYNHDWQVDIIDVDCPPGEPTGQFFDNGVPIPPLADGCETEIRDYYLPLLFGGYTNQPYEEITLQAWVPDSDYVNETPAKTLYWDGHMNGRHIPGNWQTIGTTHSYGSQIPGGWYAWSLPVDFRPIIKGSWGATFEDEPGPPQKYRFDFRALGEDGNVLYCWEEGFYQYMDFSADPISQYPQHMADDLGKMSIYFDRDEWHPLP